VENLPFQPYDIVMLVVLVGTTLFGAWKGMAWQLASFASLVVSCVVATRFSPTLAPYLSEQEPWNRFLAMLVLLLGTSLAVWLLFRLVAGIIDRVRLREFDRQMGGLLGLAKGILLCLVITFFAVTLSERLRAAVLASRSGYYTAVLIRRARPVLPDEVRNVVGKYLDQLDRELTRPLAPEPQLSRPAPSQPRPTEAPQPSLSDQLQQRATRRVEEEVDRQLEAAREAVERTVNEAAERLRQKVADTTALLVDPDRWSASLDAPATSGETAQPATDVKAEPSGGLVPVQRPPIEPGVCYVVQRTSGQPERVWRIRLRDGLLTVRDAIGQLRGLPDLSAHQVWVARPGAEGNDADQILPVDWNRRTQTVSPATNYRLRSGDRIVIAERPPEEAARR